MHLVDSHLSMPVYCTCVHSIGMCQVAHVSCDVLICWIALCELCMYVYVCVRWPVQFEGACIVVNRKTTLLYPCL